MSREPRPLRGAIYHPGGGFHSYPPPKDRWATERRVCGHCGLPADTREPDCPVCGAHYPPRSPFRRLLRRLGRS